MSKASLRNISSLLTSSVPDEDAVESTNSSLTQEESFGPVIVDDRSPHMSSASTPSCGSYPSDAPTENDIPEAHVTEGTFTIDEEISRCMVVKRLPDDATSLELTRLINVSLCVSRLRSY